MSEKWPLLFQIKQHGLALQDKVQLNKTVKIFFFQSSIPSFLFEVISF